MPLSSKGTKELLTKNESYTHCEDEPNANPRVSDGLH